MDKKVLTLSLALSLLIMTGCSNSLQGEITRLNMSYDTEQQKNIKLEKEKAMLKEKLENINMRLEKQVSIITTLTTDSADGINIYPIYTANIDNYIKGIDFYISMPKEHSLQSKLSTIAQALSEVYFSNLPIEVIEIDEKKIAVINLEEISERSTNTSIHKGSSWATGFFQGSTGGTITTIRLIESFLQRDYEGEWVEGIRLLYKGQPVDFEHVPELSKVIYRR